MEGRGREGGREGGREREILNVYSLWYSLIVNQAQFKAGRSNYKPLETDQF